MFQDLEVGIKTARSKRLTKSELLLIAKSGLLVHRGVRSVGKRGYASDPGDFGRGIYYTTVLARARCYSSEIESKEICFLNPLILMVAEAYDLADHYQTVRLPEEWRSNCVSKFDTLESHYKAVCEGLECSCQEEREQTILRNCERMTSELLAKGHDGLLSINERGSEIEVVDYRPYKKS